MTDWHNVLMFLYPFLLMFVAKLIKEKVPFFRSIVIPTSLLAGFIGLLLGPDVLGRFEITWFGRTFNLGLKFDHQFYVNVIFFCMIIGFVSLTLTNREVKQNQRSIDSGLFIVATYLVQGLVGLIVLMIMVNTFWPEFFVGLGLILPLAFGQGTGLASQVGQGWDRASGMGYAMQFGITLATVGFLVGGIGGLVLLNYYIRKYQLQPVDLKKLKGVKTQQVEFHTPTEINFFDNLLVQVVWLSIVLFLTYIISVNLYKLIYPYNSSIASVITSFSYLIGVFIAMGLRAFLRFLERSGHRTNVLLDDYMMSNISSFAMNVMITAAVMSIEIGVIKEYYPILIALSIAGTIATFLFVEFFSRYIFKGKLENHYKLVMFGMLCGVASTGLALLRGLDPDLKTETANNVVVLGSAFATVVGFPLMILLGLQIESYGKPWNDGLNLFIFLSMILYLALLITILTLRARRRFRKAD